MKKAKKTIGMLVAVEIGAVLSRYGDKLTDVSETGFDVKRTATITRCIFSKAARAK